MKNTYYIIGKKNTFKRIDKATFEILYSYDMQSCIGARVSNGKFELYHEREYKNIYEPLEEIELSAFLLGTLAALGFMEVTDEQNKKLCEKILNEENVHVAILQ